MDQVDTSVHVNLKLRQEEYCNTLLGGNLEFNATEDDLRESLNTISKRIWLEKVTLPRVNGKSQYGSIRLHRAYTATILRGLNYEHDYRPRYDYELHHGPRYRSTDRATQRCTPDQRQVLRHCAVGQVDVQRCIHTYGDRGSAPSVPLR
jgi:hypothetical protein